MSVDLIRKCQNYGCSPADTVATITRIVSASIIQQLLLFGPGRDAIDDADIYISGQFAKSSLVESDIGTVFPGAMIASFDSTGVPLSCKKAVGFAMQAMEAVLGRALIVSSNADVRR